MWAGGETNSNAAIWLLRSAQEYKFPPMRNFAGLFVILGADGVQVGAYCFRAQERGSGY